MKISSFFARLFFSFLIIIFFVSAVCFFFANKYIKTQTRDIFISQLSLNKDTVLQSVSYMFNKNDMSGLQKAVDEFAKTMRRRITVIGLGGKVLAESDRDILRMANHLDRFEVKQAFGGISGYDIRYSSTLEQEMLYTASPVYVNSKIAAVVRLSMPLNAINMFSNEIRSNVLTAIFIVFFIASLISYFFAKKISDKIKQLKDASSKLACGDFSFKIYTSSKSKDELDELADSFNRMSEKIETLFAQTANQKDRLDKILGSIDDTIILLDPAGRILLHNNAFNIHFKDINPDGKYFWEIFRDKQVENIIKTLDGTKNNMLSSEIKCDEKYYSFTASIMPANKNIVLSFHDITVIKQMDIIKKEFVTNASHELKTPLTAINGFLETAESENDIDTIRHYLSIVKKHSQRLSRIVADLLSLSEMESGKEIELSPVRLDNAVNNVMGLFKNKLAAKNLAFEFIRQEDKNYTIQAHEFYLEQMLVNLIENAVRYTEQGKITIKLYEHDNKTVLSVSDTGIGIAQEHFARIFERFYVVDKARSRKSGGTGLGLSIVKYIVNNHNASIEVSSRQNIGTTFTIKF